MKKGKIAKITVCISAVLSIIVLLIDIYAVIHQPEKAPIIVQSEPLLEKTGYLNVQDEKEESETLVTENMWDGEDEVAAVCEMMRTMDLTVVQPHMELTEEEDRAYKEAFLRMLKNELPIKGEDGDKDYYQNLWWAGAPYEDLLEARNNTDFINGYCYYYDDIDGDGKPELGVKQGAVYFFDYELGEEACSVSYGGQRTYFEKLLGIGKIWEQDIQHGGVDRDRYVVLNSDGEWETVLDLQHYYGGERQYYEINGVDVGKENWEELTAPFYEATEHEVPTKTLAEVFGELLDAN